MFKDPIQKILALIVFVTLTDCGPILKQESIVDSIFTLEPDRFNEAVSNILSRNDIYEEGVLSSIVGVGIAPVDIKHLNDQVVTYYGSTDKNVTFKKYSLTIAKAVAIADAGVPKGHTVHVLVQKFSALGCMQLSDILAGAKNFVWKPLVGLGSGYEVHALFGDARHFTTVNIQPSQSSSCLEVVSIRQIL